MPMRVEMKKAVLVVAAILALVSLAPAQDQDTRFDVGATYAGVFSKTSAAQLGNTTLKPTTSGAVLLSFRYHFHRLHGIEVNVGHTRNSQVFTIPPDTFRLNTGITEISAAYVFSPFHGKRLDPFLFGGGGVLRFSVGDQYIDGFKTVLGAKDQKPLAILYGGGADYRLWKALALRVQYRGLVYKVPDFKQTRFFTGVMGNLAEPSAGIVFKF